MPPRRVTRSTETPRDQTSKRPRGHEAPPPVVNPTDPPVVLREALHLNPTYPSTQETTFEFDDPTIEISSILIDFLDYITNTSPPSNPNLSDTSSGTHNHGRYISDAKGEGLDKAYNTIRFCQKWDCQHFLKRILIDLTISLSCLCPDYGSNYYDPQRLFLIGAEFDDPCLCATVIRTHPKYLEWCDPAIYPRNPDTWCGNDRLKDDALFPTCWEYQDFDLKPRYTYALLVATRGYSPLPTDDKYPRGDEWDDISYNFLKILEGQ
ncbi:hypothetical protein M231_04494 [Tremella mesenterica]|uniref:Uncharacterized protein n=1 Tax=Tremella mesenterica TaxID=5217 RepID=A0A4Q1BKM3_TREME|nr:hypothetical protein M231_04494 [Tremella mesenterica]